MKTIKGEKDEWQTHSRKEKVKPDDMGGDGQTKPGRILLKLLVKRRVLRIRSKRTRGRTKKRGKVVRDDWQA